jgi:hypothetical protein
MVISRELKHEGEKNPQKTGQQQSAPRIRKKEKERADFGEEGTGQNVDKCHRVIREQSICSRV